MYNDENPQEAYSIFSNIIKKHYAMCFPQITVNGTYRNGMLYYKAVGLSL